MKLRLGPKMFGGFLAMGVLLLAGGLVTILYTYRMQDVTARLLSDNVSSLKAAQELEVALFRMRGLTSNYLLSADPSWLFNLEERKRESKDWMERARQTARTGKEKAILQTISSLFLEYEQNLNTVVKLSHEGKTQEAKTLLLRNSREVFEKIYQQCEAFVAVNEDYMYATEEKVRHTNGLVRAGMYGLGLGGVLLGGIFGWMISRSIVNPIYELVLKVRDVTGDEFVERVDVSSVTEIEELDRHVHALINRINRAMADLEKNRKLLARSEKMAALGKVAASVAHEIRNPLTAIKMLIYSLREELTTDDEKRKDLAVVLKEIDRLERFVQNFLQFARPPDPILTATNVRETVHDTLTLLAPRLQQNRIEVNEVHRSDHQNILADADQVKQVVMNLILNAIEEMPNGGRLTTETLRTRATGGDGEKEWLQIRISDTGKGIPAELLDSIFDPFVSGRKNGIGLGLSVAYQIATRHQGWIEATNNKNGGATFTVCLPVGSLENGEERKAPNVQ
ncbi:MAG: ATP-binding protein [candidate division KSB1 bacterium]|nr:ATP-binding protein [candidate division KSB1 bacterium]MDZ7367266.1 ATP-binding protein [candidate division KSB1 bacterium]MDZ7405895.1 ATP-binding protein [candidate division KSB1 bacterium]